MSLLTEQEITGIANNDALWDDGKYLGDATLNEYRYARAIEAKARANLLEEIKAQGATAMVIGTPDSREFAATQTGIKTIAPYRPIQELQVGTKLYRLPEGE